MNAFHRNNTSLLAEEEATDAIAKEIRKNIAGLSYRLMPSDRWNLSVFGNITGNTLPVQWRRTTMPATTCVPAAQPTHGDMVSQEPILSYRDCKPNFPMKSIPLADDRRNVR